MMGMVYQWKGNVAPGGIDAQIVGEELERIRTFHNGRLEAYDVVEASRPGDAPLHNVFEWDDAKAAEEHRKTQAMHLIRHIDVVMEKQDGSSAPIRAFVSVKRDEDRSYTSLQHALSDEELRAQVVAQAWAELEAWHRRYAELAELAKIFALIEQARPAE